MRSRSGGPWGEFLDGYITDPATGERGMRKLTRQMVRDGLRKPPRRRKRVAGEGAKRIIRHVAAAGEGKRIRAGILAALRQAKRAGARTWPQIEVQAGWVREFPPLAGLIFPGAEAVPF